MYTHILLPTDGSQLSKRAVVHGIALAKTVSAIVTILVVVTPIQTLVVDPDLIKAGALDQYKKLIADQTEKYLNTVREAAVAAGVQCNGILVEHVHPYQAIIDIATNRGCDLIVMASHGRRGISAIVLGSEAVKVLTHSAIPVLVYRRHRSKASANFTAS